jgi:hypothetical protein
MGINYFVYERRENYIQNLFRKQKVKVPRRYIQRIILKWTLKDVRVCKTNVAQDP